MSSGVVVDMTPKERDRVEISCSPENVGTMIIWFRVLDTSGVEFIGSFAPSSGAKKTDISDRFDISKASQNKLILKSFNKNDGGIYTCAGLKSTTLHFGQLTRLVVGEFRPINMYYSSYGRRFSVTLHLKSFLRKKSSNRD